MGYIYRPKYKDKKPGDVKESAVWWIKYCENGKPIRESSKSTKEGDAKKLLKLRDGEIVEGSAWQSLKETKKDVSSVAGTGKEPFWR